MNFYTKNSSSSGFFFAAFSRGCFGRLSRWLQIFRGVETPCAGESVLGCMGNVFEILFPYETFFFVQKFRPMPASYVRLWLLNMNLTDNRLTETCHIIWRETTPSFDRRSLPSLCASSTLQSMMGLAVESCVWRVSARLRFAFAFATPPTQRQAVESGSTTRTNRLARQFNVQGKKESRRIAGELFDELFYSWQYFCWNRNCSEKFKRLFCVQ